MTMKLTAMIRRRLTLALAALAAAPAAAQHVTQVIDRSGDGRGNPLGEPRDLALDEDDNLYVVGYGSDNVFRITATTSSGSRRTDSSRRSSTPRATGRATS